MNEFPSNDNLCFSLSETPLGDLNTKFKVMYKQAAMA